MRRTLAVTATLLSTIAFVSPGSLRAAEADPEAMESGREALSAGELELLGHVERFEWDPIKAMGPAALDPLIRLYRGGDEERRANIARAFYVLGWKSDEAAKLLMGDVHTQHQNLRLQAQWALGRVSDSPAVVEVLLDNMMNDPNPLFRDKAACALAYDQIHLSEPRKVRLFEGLIDALDETNPQVRSIAILALKIHTGQDKGFAPGLPESQRTEAIARWHQWLDEYRAQL